jgi:hypothetical protein
VNVAVFGARKRNEDACESSLYLKVERLGGGPISLLSGCVNERGGCSGGMLIKVVRLRSDSRCLYRGVLVCVSPTRTPHSKLDGLLTSKPNLGSEPSI